MKIYVSHSRSFNFVEDLYKPLRESGLAKMHQFVFPHNDSQDPFPVKELFTSHDCDLILAEVSFPSTGQGIELGWADANGVKVVCFNKEGSNISGSLSLITKNFFSYKGSSDLVNKLANYLK